MPPPPARMDLDRRTQTIIRIFTQILESRMRDLGIYDEVEMANEVPREVMIWGVQEMQRRNVQTNGVSCSG